MGETGSQARAITLSPAATGTEEASVDAGSHPLRALTFFVGVVFVGGALLAPWPYQLVQALAPSSHLASHPFHRYLDRAFLLLAIAGLWPLLRSLAAGSPLKLLRKAAPGAAGRFARGLLVGVGSLAALSAVTLGAGAQHFQRDAAFGHGLLKLLEAGGIAMAVALLEEPLFRGALFGAFRKVWDWRPALLFSALVYATVHFLGKTDLPGPVHWYTGLQLLPYLFKDFTQWTQVIPGFINLTLAGVILGIAYQRTGDLYCSVGLHAGWVLWLKAYGTVITSTKGVATSFWGTSKVIDGWLALLILTALLLLLPRIVPYQRGKPAE